MGLGLSDRKLSIKDNLVTILVLGGKFLPRAEALVNVLFHVHSTTRKQDRGEAGRNTVT